MSQLSFNLKWKCWVLDCWVDKTNNLKMSPYKRQQLVLGICQKKCLKGKMEDLRNHDVQYTLTVMWLFICLYMSVRQDDDI